MKLAARVLVGTLFGVAICFGALGCIVWIFSPKSEPDLDWVTA